MQSLLASRRFLIILAALALGQFSALSYAQTPSNQSQLEQQIQSLQNITPQQTQQLQQAYQAKMAQNNASTAQNALQQAQLVGPTNQNQGGAPNLNPVQNVNTVLQPPAGQTLVQAGGNGLSTYTNPTQPLTASTAQAPSAVASLGAAGGQAPANITIPPPPAPTTPVAAGPPPPQAPQPAPQPVAPTVVAQPATPAAVPSPSFTPSQINDAAFSASVENILPMTPDQIQKLRSMYQQSQYAAASSPDTPPRPTATSVFVDLSPGATPPVIRLAQGFITSLVFIDSSGAPWPIQAYDVGNPQAFNIQWDKTTNTMMIQSMTMYNYGNLAIRLRGLPTPIMLTLIPGQKAVDYRVDLRVQGYGPNAIALPSGNGMPNSADPTLLGVLDGVPPDGSRLLSVTGGECQAWLAGNNLYVRTRLDVLSPGWLSTMSSADGMHAYAMQPTPVLLVSQNGKVVQLKIEGF